MIIKWWWTSRPGTVSLIIHRQISLVLRQQDKINMNLPCKLNVFKLSSSSFLRYLPKSKNRTQQGPACEIVASQCKSNTTLRAVLPVTSRGRHIPGLLFN